MRRSPLRHPVAVLRLKLGLTLERFGYLVGSSPSTIQSVELERRQLKPELARRISAATGVHTDCLEDASPYDELFDQNGRPYTRETYERAAARWVSGVSDKHLSTDLAHTTVELFRILSATQSHGYGYWLHRIREEVAKIKDRADRPHWRSKMPPVSPKDIAAARLAVLQGFKAISGPKRPSSPRSSKRPPKAGSSKKVPRSSASRAPGNARKVKP